MKKKNFIGWYHTGTASFDGPDFVQVKTLAHYEHVGDGTDYQWGPFPTLTAAREDLIEGAKNDIENLKYLIKNATFNEPSK